MDSIFKKRIIYAALLFVIAVFLIIYYVLFAAPMFSAEPERYIVTLNTSTFDVVANLKSKGFIKNDWAFNLALKLKNNNGIKPGGYKISKSMNAWRLAGAMTGESYMQWVVIPEGLRKEEIAEILAKKLNWTTAEKDKWIKVDTSATSDYFEGVYFPDTYLIPEDESTADVAKRLQAKFQEKFAPFSADAIKKNIKWTTLIKLASILQREAAGTDDMPLVAGILWNRLNQGMKLEVDCTIQYMRGDAGNGFWAPIMLSDKKTDSAFNTYMYKGLPPHPIANPGLEAIKAALNPEETECVFYIHDRSGNIHCTKSYEEHLQNVEVYLR